jgi:hypothetical protein
LKHALALWRIEIKKPPEVNKESPEASCLHLPIIAFHNILQKVSVNSLVVAIWENFKR